MAGFPALARPRRRRSARIHSDEQAWRTRNPRAYPDLSEPR